MENIRKHKHHKKSKYRLVIILSIVFIFILAFVIDNAINNKKKKETENINNVINVENDNYDAIVTIIDGEGESTFTDVWGELIADGYPVCSNLVVDRVGNKGYMSWETIKALQDVGIEFIFHSSAHNEYNRMTEKEVISDIERGIKAMDDYEINHSMILWIASTNKQNCELGNEYFDCGFISENGSTVLYGDKSNKMMNQYTHGYYDDKYFSYKELITLIEQARANNGWVIIFTRNNAKYMDSTQIDIYRQAFEYAKEHNVAVVTASEGYDLYYGNKLGNN